MTSEGHTKKQNGSIYCIYPNKRVKKFFNNFYTSNGLAFNKKGTKMYFADTGKDIQTIWCLKYDLPILMLKKKVYHQIKKFFLQHLI